MTQAATPITFTRGAPKITAKSREMEALHHSIQASPEMAALMASIEKKLADNRVHGAAFTVMVDIKPQVAAANAT